MDKYIYDGSNGLWYKQGAKNVAAYVGKAASSSYSRKSDSYISFDV